MWDDLVKGWLERDLRGYINPHLGRCLMLELEKGGWRKQEFCKLLHTGTGK